MGLCASTAAAGDPLPAEDAPGSREEAKHRYPGHGRKLRTDICFHDAYELGPTIGWGGFSTVKLATCRATGQQFACKLIPLPRPGRACNTHLCTRQAIMREVDALLDLDHPAVAALQEYFEWRGRLCLVTELLPGGDLLSAVQERAPLSEREARAIFRQLLLGVQHLHSRGVTHRDLKLDNLMLAVPGDASSIKIIDFGFAGKRRGDPLADVMQTVCGTPEYAAPEVIRGCRDPGCCSSKIGSAAHTAAAPGGSGGSAGAPYTSACDCWSCGVILYMLLSGEPPFSDLSQPRLLRAIVAGRYSLAGATWAGVSPQAKDLLTKLLNVDPTKRLDCAGALAHPWMQQRDSEDAGTDQAGAGTSTCAVRGVVADVVGPSGSSRGSGDGGTAFDNAICSKTVPMASLLVEPASPQPCGGIDRPAWPTLPLSSECASS